MRNFDDDKSLGNGFKPGQEYTIPERPQEMFVDTNIPYADSPETLDSIL